MFRDPLPRACSDIDASTAARSPLFFRRWARYFLAVGHPTGRVILDGRAPVTAHFQKISRARRKGGKRDCRRGRGPSVTATRPRIMGSTRKNTADRGRTRQIAEGITEETRKAGALAREPPRLSRLSILGFVGRDSVVWKVIVLYRR